MTKSDRFFFSQRRQKYVIAPRPHRAPGVIVTDASGWLDHETNFSHSSLSERDWGTCGVVHTSQHREVEARHQDCFRQWSLFDCL